MATTTPNFGWAVPTSTDLVKDGAVAIETLGDAIDASLLDLKGGTTGQVLAKASGTNMDFSWTTPAGSAFSGALITRSTTQSITNATTTTISFDTESFDVSGYHDNTNPTRLTVPTTGKYQLNFQSSLTGTTGRLVAVITKNGTEVGKSENGNNSSLSGLQISQIYSATAGDYFEFQIYQSSGSTQNTDAGNLLVQASIVFLGA